MKNQLTLLVYLQEQLRKESFLFVPWFAFAKAYSARKSPCCYIEFYN